tara:strand:- start:1338 stop:2096 length:759 start_codon:yes stop_codon:yes gene_type:complete
MKYIALSYFLTFYIFCSINSVYAEGLNYPTVLYMTKQNSKIINNVYVECESVSNSQIKCYFVQTMVRHETTQDKKDNAMKKIEKEINSAGIEAEKAFDEIHKLYCSKKTTGELNEKIAEKFNKEVGKSLLKSVKEFCKKPNKARYLNLMDESISVSTKTCKIHPNSFSENFNIEASGSWVSQTGPSGACGVIRVSTLTNPKKDDSFSWIYETRKIITNKKPKFCAMLDESVQKYTWQSEPYRMDCEYIDFGI